MTVLPEFSKISCKLQIRMIVILGFSAFVPTVSVKTGNASKIRRQIHRQGGAYMPKRGEHLQAKRWPVGGRYIRGRSPSGRAEYGYVYAGSYRECRAKRQKCLDACREAPVAASSLTLNQAAERFLADKQDDLKRSTLARYTYVLEHYILPVFGAVLLSQLTANQISEFLRRLQKNGLSRKSARDVGCY